MSTKKQIYHITLDRFHVSQFLKKLVSLGWCQLYNTASAGRLKKLDSIPSEGIRIYTGAFRTSPVEALNVERKLLTSGTKKEQMRIRFPYKLKTNTSYIETLNTLNDRENQSYEKIKGRV